MEFFSKLAQEESVTIAAAAPSPTTPANTKKKKSGSKGKNTPQATSGSATTTATAQSPSPLTPHGDVLRILQQLQWDSLFFDRGMPAVTPDFSNSLSVAAESLAVKWIDAAYASTSTEPHEVAPPSNVSARDIEVTCYSVIYCYAVLVVLLYFPVKISDRSCVLSNTKLY
jgi:hypothetical protein